MISSVTIQGLRNTDHPTCHRLVHRRRPPKISLVEMVIGREKRLTANKGHVGDWKIELAVCVWRSCPRYHPMLHLLLRLLFIDCNKKHSSLGQPAISARLLEREARRLAKDGR